MDSAPLSADGWADGGVQDLVGRQNKKEYDSFLTSEPHDVSFQTLLKTDAGVVWRRAQECMAEKNFAGCILWLHRAIESDPNSSSHWADAGAVFVHHSPEYRREAVEQFELAILVGSRAISPRTSTMENCLEQLKAPWRAPIGTIFAYWSSMSNHWEARERVEPPGVRAHRA